MVNGRISERSFRRWRKAPRFIAALLAAFDVCLARSEADYERLTALGAPSVLVAGDIKFDAPNAAGGPPRARRARRPHFGAPDVDRRLYARGRRDDRGGRAQAPRPGVSRRADPDRAAPSRARPGDPAAIRGAGPKLRAALALRRDHVLGPRSTSATRSANWDSFIAWRGWCSSASLSSPAAAQNPIEPAGFASAILHGPMVENFAEDLRRARRGRRGAYRRAPGRLGGDADRAIRQWGASARYGSRGRRYGRAPRGSGRSLDACA